MFDFMISPTIRLTFTLLRSWVFGSV